MTCVVMVPQLLIQGRCPGCVKTKQSCVKMWKLSTQDILAAVGAYKKDLYILSVPALTAMREAFLQMQNLSQGNEVADGAYCSMALGSNQEKVSIIDSSTHSIAVLSSLVNDSFLHSLTQNGKKQCSSFRLSLLTLVGRGVWVGPQSPV